MNMFKKATRTLLSLTLATGLFLSTNISGSVADASVGKISYKIDDPNTKKLAEIDAEYSDMSGKTVILTTNDVHGAIDGYPYIASLKNYFTEKNADKVILIDSGDFSQTKTKNTQYITTSNGLAIDCMNAAGYDYAGLGNHEAMSLGKLTKNYKDGEENFKIINSNVLKKIDENGYEPLFTPNCTEKIGDTTIGFFGIVTRDGFSERSGDYKLDDPMSECAQKQCDKLRNDDKADVVICIAHLGLEDKFMENKDEGKEGERSVDLFNKVNGIDLILDAHSHSVITPSEGREQILSTGTEFENIGVVIIDNNADGNNKKISDTFLIADEEFKKLTPDSATAAEVEKIKHDYETSKSNSGKKHGH